MANLTTTLETLLGNEAFVRQLSHRLVYESADADDVAQQTWLAALERAPDTVRHPKAFLATVVRNERTNLVRGAARRGVRERSGAEPEATRSTVDVLEREELRRRVVAAVLALEEPYRTSVLMRYFDEFAPREIASGLQVPVATVKSRLKRGLRMLRQTLDAGGDRAAWALGLIALAGAGAAAGEAGAAEVAADSAAPAATDKSSWAGRAMSVGAAAAVCVLAGLLLSGPNATDPGRSAGGATSRATVGLNGISPNAGASAADAAADGAAPSGDGSAAAAIATQEASAGGAAPILPAAGQSIIALKGTVVDLAAKSVSGAEVRVYRGLAAHAEPWCGSNRGVRGLSRPPELLASVRTDEAGRFAVPRAVLGTGLYELHADLVGSGTGVGAVRIGPAGPATTQLRLCRAAPLTGRVINEAGSPVGRATVQAFRSSGGLLANVRWAVSTDADGRFEFSTLPPGNYQLLNGGAGHPWRYSPLHRAPAAELVLTMLTPMVVSGTVTDGRTGEAVAFARLSTSYHRRRGGQAGGWETAVADAQGRFRILASAGADRVDLVARADGYASTMRSLAAQAGAVRADIAFQPGKLSGRVVDASTRAPVADAQVWVTSARDAAIFHGGGAMTRTDAGGRFTLRGLPSSQSRGAGPAAGEKAAEGDAAGGGVARPRPEIQVSVQAAGYLVPLGRAIQVDAGADGSYAEFLLEPAGRVIGVVRDTLGRPVAGAAVAVRTLPSSSRARTLTPVGDADGVEGPTVFADSQGRFEMSSVRTGADVRLIARHAEFAPTISAPFESRPTSAPATVNITMRAGAEVCVRVSDVEGTPVSGVFVTLQIDRRTDAGAADGTTNANGIAVQRRALTAHDGTVRLRGLPATRYWISVGDLFDPGYLRTHAGVDLRSGDDTTLDIALKRAYRVTGRVVDEAGRPVGRVRFVLSGARKQAYTDADGNFEVRRVSDERQSLRFEDGWALRDPAQQLAGGDRDVVVRVRRQ